MEPIPVFGWEKKWNLPILEKGIYPIYAERAPNRWMRPAHSNHAEPLYAERASSFKSGEPISSSLKSRARDTQLSPHKRKKNLYPPLSLSSCHLVAAVTSKIIILEAGLGCGGALGNAQDATMIRGRDGGLLGGKAAATTAGRWPIGRWSRTRESGGVGRR